MRSSWIGSREKRFEVKMKETPTLWKPYPVIESNRIYETIVDGRNVGKTLVTLLGGRHEPHVVFVENQWITCYKVNSYDMRDGTLLLERPQRRRLSDIESAMLARSLKRKGLL